LTIPDNVGANTAPDVSTRTSIPVILSGAPPEFFTQEADRRGVEEPVLSLPKEPQHFLVLPCGIKAFSRELPDASVAAQTSSGSFDSPSLLLGLAQDDSGRKRPFREISFRSFKQLCEAFWVFVATVREIFDENAYERFLVRAHAARSVASYRDFLREREAALARKPRCC
jgi:hypothetical protein